MIKLPMSADSALKHHAWDKLRGMKSTRTLWQCVSPNAWATQTCNNTRVWCF